MEDQITATAEAITALTCRIEGDEVSCPSSTVRSILELRVEALEAAVAALEARQSHDALIVSMMLRDIPVGGCITS